MQAAAAARKKLTDEVKAFQKQSELDEVSVEAIINKAVAHADLQCKRCQDSEEAFMFTFKSVLPMGRTSRSFCSFWTTDVLAPISSARSCGTPHSTHGSLPFPIRSR